jgi:serine/threonine protein kinase
LTHPHIAVLYGFEEHAGRHALVMELVEGPTLSERLLQGPLPAPEAIAIARQLTDALDAAHEKGIIHRDLKPSNIKLTSGGTVKVLDFGLAKACEPGGSEMAESPPVTASDTRSGTLLGTPAYMSPEQARGQLLDKRADIWAFGCVLYEMLTGCAAFAGETVSDTLARVLQREPDWERLPASTPPLVRRLLRRCLEKNPRQRPRDIGDARVDLDESWDDPHEQTRAPLVASPRAIALWAAAGLALASFIAGAVGWVLKPTSPPAISRFSHVLNQHLPFTDASRSLAAVAPDGSAVVYTAGGRLYRRALNELDAYPIRGPRVHLRRPSSRPMGRRSATGTQRPASSAGLRGGRNTGFVNASHRPLWRKLGARRHDRLWPAGRDLACVGERRRTAADRANRGERAGVRPTDATRWQKGSLQPREA